VALIQDRCVLVNLPRALVKRAIEHLYYGESVTTVAELYIANGNGNDIFGTPAKISALSTEMEMGRGWKMKNERECEMAGSK
jgi:hypothetical protein